MGWFPPRASCSIISTPTRPRAMHKDTRPSSASEHSSEWFRTVGSHAGQRELLTPSVMVHGGQHWLIFSSILEGAGEKKLQFKPREDAQLAAFDNGGSAPGEDELAAPWLWKLSRYRIEPALELLLAKSAEIGYCGDECANWWQEELHGRPSLLDIKDKHGNTALHWTVAHRRVDLVSLLLCHGASVAPLNKAGQTVFDMVQWQKAEGAAQKARAGASWSADEEMKSAELDEVCPHPLVAQLDTSIYLSPTHKVERQWGTREGLRIEQCSYEGETDEAAIKRLIFQRLLFNATDAGDDGDLEEVERLVALWQAAYAPSAGHRMWPLTYRADSDFNHPLQTAVSYASDSTAVLRALLRLPWSFHVQPRRFEYAALPLAVVNSNWPAVRLLLAAGFNVNMRDAANGKTCLHAIAELKTMDEAAALVTDGDSAYATSSTLCRLTRELIQRGADPAIVDELGNTPLIIAAHRGDVGLVGLYLAWSARQEALARPGSASLYSPFVRHVNVFGNSALHYAMYRVHASQRHVSSLQLLCSTGVWPNLDEPLNRAGLSPLQLLAAPDTKYGERACRTVLKMTVDQVWKAHSARKIRKKKTLFSDLSHGVERFPVEVVTDFEVSVEETAALANFTYVTANHWTKPTNETEATIPPINAAATTISEALHSQGDTRARNFTPKPKKAAAGLASTTGDDDDDSMMEDEPLVVEGEDNPAETRRLLSTGLAVPVQVRMTHSSKWGLFARQFIPRGSFVCEYVGDLLTSFESDRRSLLYISQGMHPVYQFGGLSNLDGDQFTVDPQQRGSASRFINHSCEPNLDVRVVLDRTRLALYALRDIQPREELTMDYMYRPTEVGATFICHCGEKSCQRTLL